MPAAGQTPSSRLEDLETITYRDPGSGATHICPGTGWGGRLATCKRRACPRCGHAWARSWEECTRCNLTEYGGPVALVSITPPGEDLLPWACDKPHRHRGSIGCQVDAQHADAWAASCRDNWRRLRDAARVATIRKTGGLKPTLLQRVWEPQKRGVPHLHLVLGMATHAERMAAQVFVLELSRLAGDHFFGFVDRKLALISAREAARYLSAYLTGRSGKKGSVRDNLADPRMPRSLIWLTPVLTRATRVTMRTLRYVRWVHAARSGRCEWPVLRGDLLWNVSEALARLERQRAPGGEAPALADPAGWRRVFYAIRRAARPDAGMEVVPA